MAILSHTPPAATCNVGGGGSSRIFSSGLSISVCVMSSKPIRSQKSSWCSFSASIPKSAIAGGAVRPVCVGMSE